MIVKKNLPACHLTIIFLFYLIKSSLPQILSNIYITQQSPFDVILNFNVTNSHCNIDYFMITTTITSYTNTVLSGNYSTNSTSAYQSFCKENSSTQNPSFDCKQSNSDFSVINCNLNITDLKPNSKYSFVIEAISNAFMGQYISYDYLTGVEIPSIVGITVMSSLKNNIGLQFSLPSIDQTYGKVVKLYLYLVEICLNSVLNFTIPSDLNIFVNNTENCSSLTNCSVVCQTYSNDFYNSISSITIVSTNNTNLIENTTSNLIQNPIIKIGHSYSTFFVFEVRNMFDLTSKNENFFSSPTITVQVKDSSQPSPNNGSNANNVNSIQDWQIILICCVVIFISLIIIVLVIAFVFRKRIKNLCKRYGGKYKPNIELIYKDDASNKLSLVNKYEFNSRDIKKVCSIKRANDNYLFEQEFKSLPDYHNVKSSNASNDIKNAIKNRYTDIKAFDESRVILKNEYEEVENSDYINANFVQGYFNDKKFIATQGPKLETIGDFWKMIQQNNVKIIVMLTDLIENNVTKCQRYWPNNLNSTETYNEDYIVTFLDERVYVDYVKRTLKLVQTRKKNLIKHDEESRLITQYFYPSWADKLTPNTDLISIFNLIREVNLAHNADKESPIVVHCSAGKF